MRTIIYQISFLSNNLTARRSDFRVKNYRNFSEMLCGSLVTRRGRDMLLPKVHPMNPKVHNWVLPINPEVRY